MALGGTLEPRFAPMRAALGPIGGLEDHTQGVFQRAWSFVRRHAPINYRSDR